jgi:hypothetical protein
MSIFFGINKTIYSRKFCKNSMANLYNLVMKQKRTFLFLLGLPSLKFFRLKRLKISVSPGERD